MLLSIIIPIYNVDLYLSQCLDSLSIDKHNDIEVILINDGSTDSSYDICYEFSMKFKNVKLLTQTNKGLSSARNLGIENIQGDDVWFIDSDDYVMEGSIFKIKNILLNNDLDLIHFNYYKMNHAGLVCVSKIDKNEFLSGSNILNDFNNFFPGIWSYIFKSDLIKKLKMKFELNIIYEDDYFHHNYLNYFKKCLLLNECLYVYRIRENSLITSNSQKNIFLKLYSLRKILNLVNKNENLLVFEKNKFLDSYFYRYMNLFFLAVRLGLSKDLLSNEMQVFKNKSDIFQISKINLNYGIKQFIFNSCFFICNSKLLFSLFWKQKK